MPLSKNSESSRHLKLKGLLFGLLGLLAAATFLVDNLSVQNFVLFAIAVWAFCRLDCSRFSIFGKLCRTHETPLGTLGRATALLSQN